jgi:hypothetical protein
MVDSVTMAMSLFFHKSKEHLDQLNTCLLITKIPQVSELLTSRTEFGNVLVLPGRKNITT